MTEEEYKYIQERLSHKLIRRSKGCLTAKEQEYNKGILSAKSIIKDVYEKVIV